MAHAGLRFTPVGTSAGAAARARPGGVGARPPGRSRPVRAVGATLRTGRSSPSIVGSWTATRSAGDLAVRTGKWATHVAQHERGGWCRARGALVVLVASVALVAGACSSDGTVESGATTSLPGLSSSSGDGPPGSGTSSTTSTTEAEVDDDAVRDIDFANFTYAPDSCGDPAQRTAYEVVDGTSAGDDMNVSVDVDATAYGDVTGDGITDAVVLITCNAGGNAGNNVPLVYTVDDEGEPERLGILTGTDRDDAAVVGVSISDGQILTDEVVFAPDDPRCCPSGTGTTIWEWVDGSFVIVNSTEDTQDVPPPSARPTVDPFSIRVDGVGPFFLGMTADELRANGVDVITTEPVCGTSVYEAEGAPDGLFLVLDDAGSLRAISVSSPAYLTDANASVDSFDFDLQSVYPNLEYFSFGPDLDGQYAVFSPDRASGIYFNVSGEEVMSITVTYGDTGFMDLC